MIENLDLDADVALIQSLEDGTPKSGGLTGNQMAKKRLAPKSWPMIQAFYEKQFRLKPEKMNQPQFVLEKTNLVRYFVALMKLRPGAYQEQKKILRQKRNEEIKAERARIKAAEAKKMTAPLAFRFYEEPAAVGGARFMPGNTSGSSQVDPGLAGVTAPDTDQGPLSGARFMPGYNPRYTDDDGNFDRDAWLADVRKGEEYLRSRGITRANTEKDPYEQMLREALRGPRR